MVEDDVLEAIDAALEYQREVLQHNRGRHSNHAAEAQAQIDELLEARFALTHVPALEDLLAGTEFAETLPPPEERS